MVPGHGSGRPVSPARLSDTLREQRAARLKGGLYHLTQVRMVYNTNRIEGNQLSEDQTRYIYESRTIGGRRTVSPGRIELAVEEIIHDRAVQQGAQGQVSFEGIVDFHYRFEHIHPFQQRLQNKIMPFIVLDSQKEFYYRGLAGCEVEPGYLRGAPSAWSQGRRPDFVGLSAQKRHRAHAARPRL